MSSDRGPGFVWVTCQPGMEAALKAEIASEFGDRLAAAYQRPGWVTWKALPHVFGGSTEALGAWRPRTPLAARGWGVSLEQVRVGRDGAWTAQLDAALERAGVAPATHVLQAWVRPEFASGEEPPQWLEDARRWRAEAARERSASGWRTVERASPGQKVLDLARIGEGVVFLGAHRAEEGRSAWAGGQFPPDRSPGGAPSRAALKLEEMLDWSGLDPQAGECALEIGAAPGGACHALLARGLSVVGVDPARMDERLLPRERFRHVARTFTELAREDLRGEPVHWLLVDLNGPGEVAIDALEKVLPWVRGSVKGAVLTLKIGDLRRLAAVEPWTRRLESLGFRDVRMAQLSQHRQELGAAARWKKT